MRQTFRKNVSSLDVVERLLKQPEKLLVIDEELISDEQREGNPSSPKSLKKELEQARQLGKLCLLFGFLICPKQNQVELNLTIYFHSRRWSLHPEGGERKVGESFRKCIRGPKTQISTKTI